MRCIRCPATENLRNVKPFGLLCYKCFKKIVDRMEIYQDEWFNEDVFPQIKMEIIDNIRTKPDFDLDKFIEDSGYDSEAVQIAIEDMMFYETLPEYVRVFLHSYRNYEIELDGLDGD